MNGIQIEHLLELIDSNIGMTRREAAAYIRDHQQEIADSLVGTGSAVIKTTAGDLTLSRKDLELTAA